MPKIVFKANTQYKLVVSIKRFSGVIENIHLILDFDEEKKFPRNEFHKFLRQSVSTQIDSKNFYVIEYIFSEIGTEKKDE